MQFDADTVGSASPAADAEICMMAADTMEALGIPRGSYVVKINNRKVLDGVLESIDLGAIHSRGFAFQIETTYRALRKGFRVVEVPITFVDRTAGGSKMSRAIVLEAVWKVPALRLRALTGRL